MARLGDGAEAALAERARILVAACAAHAPALPPAPAAGRRLAGEVVDHAGDGGDSSGAQGLVRDMSIRSQMDATWEAIVVISAPYVSSTGAMSLGTDELARR